MDNISQEAEEATNKGERGTLCSMTKTIANAHARKEVPVLSNDRKITTESGQ